nr:hypothetical protein Iba_chr09dCG10720 [Ipomoea batatas]
MIYELVGIRSGLRRGAGTVMMITDALMENWRCVLCIIVTI